VKHAEPWQFLKELGDPLGLIIGMVFFYVWSV
jgi:hypothetical protein